MKKILLISLLINLISFSNTTVENNKKKINQIEKQVNDNKKKISNNNVKISNAKKSESELKNEIKGLDNLISKLQSEYSVIEKEYVELLKSIGKSEKEIKQSIAKIVESTQQINENKTDYSNKIKLWNKAINAKELKNNTQTTDTVKKQRDLSILLDKKEEDIKKIETYKLNVEAKKKKEEILKTQKEKKAKKVEKKKKELEAKRAELRNAKLKKDRTVKELQRLQSNLNSENKKIEKTNTSLLAEKKKLEQQINNIIAEARRRQQELAKKQHDSNKDGTSHSVKEVVVPKGTGEFIMPVNGPIVVAYGSEKSKGLISKGIEIRGTLGQAVKASDDGVILYSGSLKGLGAVIMIDHGKFITVYGNLASVKVANGAKVKKGQTIGTLGKDTISKEPNLYFEVRKGVNYVNPANYL